MASEGVGATHNFTVERSISAFFVLSSFDPSINLTAPLSAGVLEFIINTEDIHTASHGRSRALGSWKIIRRYQRYHQKLAQFFLTHA